MSSARSRSVIDYASSPSTRAAQAVPKPSLQGRRIDKGSRHPLAEIALRSSPPSTASRRLRRLSNRGASHLGARPILGNAIVSRMSS